MRILPVTAGAAVSTALLVAACGGGSPAASGGGTAAARYAGAAQRAPAAVRVAKARRAVVATRKGSLGTYLVDGRGRTLYLFERDEGRASRCYGACAGAWPPLMTAGKPAARGAAKGSALATSRRRGGGRQVDYHGHPLYSFVQDTKAGQTNGQGVKAFGAKWYVVAPSGHEIDDD
jgi:predicted lipoprotein with Yx(FWY)xxD motif